MAEHSSVPLYALPLPLITATVALVFLLYFISRFFVDSRRIPLLIVAPADSTEADDVLSTPVLSTAEARPQIQDDPTNIRCWDPTTMRSLGTVKVDLSHLSNSPIPRTSLNSSPKHNPKSFCQHTSP